MLYQSNQQSVSCSFFSRRTAMVLPLALEETVGFLSDLCNCQKREKFQEISVRWRELYLSVLEIACAWDHWEICFLHLHLWKGLRTPGSQDTPCMCLKKEKAMSISSKLWLYELLLLLWVYMFIQLADILLYSSCNAVCSYFLSLLPTKRRGVGENNTLYSLPLWI